MDIHVKGDDKLLITKFRNINRVGYQGGRICEDPNACWANFSTNRSRTRTCKILAAQNRDGKSSLLPSYVVTASKGNHCQEIHLPILYPDGGAKIDVGYFPRGDIESAKVVMPDGKSVELRDTNRAGLQLGEQILDISVSPGLSVFRQSLLKRIRKEQFHSSP